MSEKTVLIDAPSAADDARYPRPRAELPRLLAGIPAHGAMSLDEHLAVHGELPAQRRRRRREEPALLGALEDAGLRGHGGAGFPTARKLRAAASSRGKPVVVVNGAEGEPASIKDRTLLQTLPHLVLDGAQLAAGALGAGELIVCACESAPASLDRVAEAIGERRGLAGDVGRVQLSTAPSGYVTGQESALVNHLNGGPGLPTFTPPMAFEQGVRRRPTLVSNVETFAHIALIARHGAGWFRQLGTASQPGSALVTLSGPVRHAGVYEIEYGASLASLIEAAGGTTATPRAALLGGYGGSWIAGELLRGVGLSDEHLAPLQASFGAGVVALLSQDACPVAETTRVARWLALQSARQCGPCVHGLDAIARSFEELAAGMTQGNPMARIARLAELVRRRGACAHPDGTARFVASALEAFPTEIAEHAHRGPCAGCRRPGELPLPPHAPERAGASAPTRTARR
ncbi:MAG TPA: NADH-ubiquinone oxidoreductase-F iron-sulfur binding region domain-containing protein [Solirubrobacteraceae bacterium]|nr:NADH-ubiquinone oxidoreductase-F iron-sulfur binding region domain-containing protein [Solirubrobacteraceae bacterium]